MQTNSNQRGKRPSPNPNPPTQRQRRSQAGSKPGVRTQSKQAPAARASKAAGVGLADIQLHKISWLAGYTYVGDGVLGNTDGVHFRAAGNLTVVPQTAGTSNATVPLLGSDTTVGQTYVSDIQKHYARKRVHSAKVHFVSLQPATSNSMMLYAGPVRGPGAAGDTLLVAGAQVAPALANVLAMSGSQSCASWESMTLDLTKFIAGGSGARQNEFALNRDGDDAATTWGAANMDLDLICPAAFVVTGSNTTAALRGTNVHLVIIEEMVDLLDFVGGVNNPVPLALTAEEKLARRVFIESLTELQKKSLTSLVKWSN